MSILPIPAARARAFTAALAATFTLWGCTSDAAASLGEEPASTTEQAPAAPVAQAPTSMPTSAPTAPTADEHAGHAGHAGHANHVDMPAAELPGTSIYNLDVAFVDQTGTPVPIASLRGKPAVFVMFYASCTTACPILFADGRRLEQMLPEDVRESVRFVYVTIDPSRDTPQALQTYAERLNLDASRWRLLSGDDDGTLQLAAVLGVQFRADGAGDFSHTNRLSIVDAEGSVVRTVDGLQQPLEAAAAELNALVSGAE